MRLPSSMTCNECPSRVKKFDPNPYDLFRYDDIKFLCGESKNKVIIRYCRPYDKVKIPNWCPLKGIE